MSKKIEDTAEVVLAMEKYLNGKLRTNQRWENTYIKKQIDKRKSGGVFTLEDHIRAMVYSMLSAGIAWERINQYVDETTGRITMIDEVFRQYNPEFLLQSDPSELRDKIKGLHCATQYTFNQMQALINENIPKLIMLDKKYGMEKVYQQFQNADETLKTLVVLLSSPNSCFKLHQMGEALVAEYLRNVGYEIAKPDRHIRRILGSEVLGCSGKKEVPIYEAFDIVSTIADESGKSKAKVDYILWAYCAKGYGEICTVDKRNCNNCVIHTHCNKKTNESEEKKYVLL